MGRVPGAGEQLPRDLAARGAVGGHILAFDPLAILAHEGEELSAGLVGVGKPRQILHAERDPLEPRRGHELDLGLGDPARLDRVASPVRFHGGMGRDAVAHGVLVDVAVLQVADPLVPLAVVASPDVRAGHERLLGVDLELRLERETRVPEFVGGRASVVHQEHGDRPGSLGDHPLGDPDGLDRPDQHRERQPVGGVRTIRHPLLPARGRVSPQLDLDHFLPRGPLPEGGRPARRQRGSGTRRREGSLLGPGFVRDCLGVVAPAGRDLESLGLGRDEDAQAHRGRQESTSRGGTFGGRGVVGPACLVARSVHLVVRCLVGALGLAGFQRDEEPGQVPAGGSLGKHLLGQVRGRLGADQVEPQGLDQSLADLDGFHARLILPGGPGRSLYVTPVCTIHRA